MNQVRLDYSSLVSCGQQHREPRRAIFIPLMKAIRNPQRLTLGLKRGGAETGHCDYRIGCGHRVFVSFCFTFVCFCLRLYELLCNIVCREL